MKVYISIITYALKYKLFSALNLICLLYYLLVFPSLYAASPSLRFERLTIEDGLSQSTVRCIVQDSQGFLWIGTSDGLNRYDGYNLKIYKHDPDDPSTISNNRIHALYEDSHGVLWIGTYGGGLNRFDREQERFIHYRHDPTNLNSLSNDKVSALHEDAQGTLWVGTHGGGLNSFDRDRKRFIHYRHDKTDASSLSHDYVNVLNEDSQGMLWVGTRGGGLNRFEQEHFIHYRHNPANLDSLSHDHVYALHEDSQGSLWVGTEDGGLNRLNPQRNRFFHYRHEQNDPNSLNSDVVRGIHEDRRGRLWIGTAAGLSWFDRSKQKFIHHQHDPAASQSLSSNYVITLYEDKQGLLWIGTSIDGLNRFNPASELFNHYHHNTEDSKSLSDSAILSIQEDSQGLLWIGTYDGILEQFDPDTNQFIHYSYNQADPHNLIRGRIKALYEDRQSVLWIGSYGGLSRFDRLKERFDHYYYDESDLSNLSNQVLALHEDREGALWVGTRNGLNRLDPQRQGFTHYRHEPGNPTSLSGEKVFALLVDSNSTLWVGTNNGLSRFELRQNQFHNYQYDDIDSSNLSSGAVTALYEDKQGILWVGTLGGGLNRFDTKSQKFTHYREKDGLVNNVVLGILEDDSGHLWISTNQGLSKFDPTSEQFRNYSAEDGLQSNEFALGSYFKSQSGELFFGGINGFNRFFPEQINKKHSPPTLAFTDFLIFNQSIAVTTARKASLSSGTTREKIKGRNNNFVLQKSINTTKQLTLSHQQSLFSFEFSALDFISPKRNQYAYKLEGWDQDWIYTNYKNRLATYTNIPSGDYNLKVKARNKGGSWNEKGINMAITILPPWWLTLKMKLLYGVFSLILLALIFYRLTVVPTKRALLLETQVRERTAELKHKRDYIQQLLKLNTQFTQNISHSLKTPLTLILGPIERMINYRQISQSALLRVKRNALRLQKDVDLLVSFSRFSGTAPTVKTLYDIAVIAAELVDDFQDAFAQKQLLLTLDADNELWFYAESDAVERVLVNLLENAMKYTPIGGRVTVVIRQEIDYVELKVSDTGIGIPLEKQQIIFERGIRLDPAQDQQGTGIGLTFIKEILQRNGGKIKVASKPDQGSTFIVHLPTSAAPLNDENKTKPGISANTKNLVSTITTLVQSQDNATPSINMDTEHQQEGKPRLLIVEDDEDMRAFIVESFADNYMCLQAKDGEEGLSMAQNHSPDLVISDVMMPNKSGQQMLQELKADPEISHIPVILVTAASDRVGQEKAIASGAIHYFSKPFDENDMKQAVNEALDIQTFTSNRIEKYLIDNIPVCLSEFPFIGTGDITLLNKFGTHIHKHYADPEFTNPIKALAPQLYMEQRRLRRKLDTFLNHNPTTVLRDLRLERGRSLLENGVKPSQVYIQIGFSSQDYFGRCFRSKYGSSPAEYQKEHYGENRFSIDMES